MRNDLSILLAAIVVIIIVLAGAYALSGSSPAQPTATPTATAMPQASATPVPTSPATVTATAEPTATPVPTPTPTAEPDSGVRQTEFGYWTTYPTLGPQTWSSPRPATPGNVVYFNPTSQSITPEIRNFLFTPSAEAIVHRDGDLNQTTSVLISIGGTENMFRPKSIDGVYVIPTGIGSMNVNLTDNQNETYTLVFDPDVSEQTIYIEIFLLNPNAIDTLDGSSFTGELNLTIVAADAPFTFGDGSEYSLYMTKEFT